MERSSTCIWASVLVLALLVVPAFADSAATDGAAIEAPAEEATPEYTEVTFNGMTIGIDKKTGRMRPLTKREAAKLKRKMQRMFGGPSGGATEFVAHSGGMRSAVLGQRHLNFEVLHIDAGGNHVGQCVDNLESATEALIQPIEPAPAPEEM